METIGFTEIMNLKVRLQKINAIYGFALKSESFVWTGKFLFCQEGGKRVLGKKPNALS
jgi:hypothetical protein